MTVRIVSALLLLPVLLGLVYWDLWATAALVAVSVFAGLRELYAGFAFAGYQPRRRFGIGLALSFCLAAVLQTWLPFDVPAMVFALGLIFSLTYELLPRHREAVLTNWALTFAGACYVGGLLSYYIQLRDLGAPLQPALLGFLQVPPGAAWVYMVLAITWMQDSAAYFAGRSFGRHKMSPYISPNKTWEGAAGGLVGAVAAAGLAAWLLGLPIALPGALLLGAVGGVIGPFGDLVESLIKRQVGVKDAGNLIPGHGGILDRMDSMLFTAPALYYLILLLTVQGR